MNEFLNCKVLITTCNWFYGTDGKQYKSAWGTLKGIHEAGKTLGFIPNRSHANWFLELGSMMIMGCQVLYIIRCDEQPNIYAKVSDWVNHYGKCSEFERPSAIFIAE
jgi:hypothetical protein